MHRKNFFARTTVALLLSMAATQAFAGASASGVYHVEQFDPVDAPNNYFLVYDGPGLGPLNITVTGISVLTGNAPIGIDGFSGSALISGGTWKGGGVVGSGVSGVISVTNGGYLYGNYLLGANANISLGPASTLLGVLTLDQMASTSSVSAIVNIDTGATATGGLFADPGIHRANVTIRGLLQGEFNINSANGKAGDLNVLLTGGGTVMSNQQTGAVIDSGVVLTINGGSLFDAGARFDQRGHLDIDGVTVSGAGSILKAGEINIGIPDSEGGQFGNLTVSSGALVQATDFRLGVSANVIGGGFVFAPGFVTFDAATLTTGRLSVGESWEGSLIARGGATIEAANLEIASKALLHLTGGGTTATITNATGGTLQMAEGGLFITDEAFLTTDTATISNGKVISSIVLDQGSWTSKSDLVVAPRAAISVTNESTLDAQFISLGNNLGSFETSSFQASMHLTADAGHTGPTVTAAGGMRVGDSTAAILIVDAGTLTADYLTLGEQAQGDGLFIVAGTDLNTSGLVNLHSYLPVGLNGMGSMTVKENGVLNIQESLDIGENEGSSGFVALDGKDSLLSIGNNNLLIGRHGKGEMKIDNEAILGVSNVYVGELENGDGMLTVVNAGYEPPKPGVVTKRRSALLTDLLVVGLQTTGNLTVAYGGRVDAHVFRVGDLPVDTGTSSGFGTVIVKDGGILAVHGSPIIGAQGKADVSILATGTFFTDEISFVAEKKGSTASLLVDGSGSIWDSAEQIQVGVAGMGSLTITGGGLVNSHKANSPTSTAAVLGLLGNDDDRGIGTALVSGNNSKWSLEGNLVVGFDGTGALTIASNAIVENADGIIGRNGNADARSLGAVSVLSNGKWNNAGTLFVGKQGDASLLINGGNVTALNTIIGENPADPAQSFSLIVSGSTGTMTTTETFRTNKGRSDIGVSIGGKFKAGTTRLATDPTGIAVMLVNASSAVEAGHLTLGEVGTGRISLLGIATSLKATDAVLGDKPNSLGILEAADFSNTVTFGDTTIGREGRGSIVVVDANTFTLGDTILGEKPNGVGTITYELGGKLTTQTLTVGKQGTATLTLRNKVNFSTGDVTIAENAGSAGELTIESQTKWLAFNAVTVGHQGDGILNINSGATAAAGDVTVADNNTGTGQIILTGAGSKLTATKLTIGTATGAKGDALVKIGAGATITSPTATLNKSGILSGKGKFTGKLTNNGGKFAPGSSPGNFEIEGDFEQTAGILEIEAAGLAPDDHDQILATGNIHIHGGTIEFRFIEGYLPALGDTFTFLHGDAGTTIDVPSTALSFPTLASGFQFALEPNLSGGLQFRAITQAAPVPEPATLLVGMSAAVLLAGRRRR